MRAGRIRVRPRCSHAAGVGSLLPNDVVRAMLVLRANALAVGLSGVRQALPELLCAMVNAGVHPLIPSRGDRTKVRRAIQSSFCIVAHSP